MDDEIYINKPEELFAAIEKEKRDGKLMVAQIAPAVRVSIGEEFGREPGEDLTYKAVGLLRELGFDHVMDTPLGADVNIYEETLEVLNALERGDNAYFPVFNSCCIGWRLYCRNKHPKLYRLVSPICSPHMIAGSLGKHVIAKKLEIPIEKICMVSVMPCVLKKYEAKERLPSGIRYVDYVLTTQELGKWAKKRGLDISRIPEGKFTELLPDSSKDGVIFGATGGITEALLSTLACMCGKSPEKIKFRSDEQVKHLCVQIGRHRLNVVSIYGVANLDRVLDEIKQGAKYHFVEVMNCPYGCVGGPGQPLPASDAIYRARAAGLRKAADRKPGKCPLGKMGVHSAYEALGIRPGSREAQELFFFHKTNI